MNTSLDYQYDAPVFSDVNKLSNILIKLSETIEVFPLTSGRDDKPSGLGDRRANKNARPWSGSERLLLNRLEEVRGERIMACDPCASASHLSDV